MPRKLDRAPRKTSTDDTQPARGCTCQCKSPTDKNGEKTQPEIDQATLSGMVFLNVG